MDIHKHTISPGMQKSQAGNNKGLEKLSTPKIDQVLYNHLHCHYKFSNEKSLVWEVCSLPKQNWYFSSMNYRLI
ncbi:hypothetical protein XENTR_v10009599 [Xenopus tropicalis]|nr:hypothetical protein XENTR_v10009599 [Xenopus tropicalis]